MTIRGNIDRGKYEARPGPNGQYDRKHKSEESARILESFRHDLALEYDIPSGPIEREMWSRARADGSSGGLDGILLVYEDLHDFFVIIRDSL